MREREREDTKRERGERNRDECQDIKVISF